MFNITNILRNICALTHVFGSFGLKTALHQSVWWDFLLFSISKKEYLTVQKKNFYKVEELGRESTCAKNAHVPFWNIWIMKERADSVVVA